MAAEEFLHLSGVVRTSEGYRTIRRGEQLPETVLPEEAERLRANGAYGEPKVPEATDALGELDDDALALWVAENSAKDVVARAEGDPALAERLLAIEQDGKDRKSAVEGLEAVVDGD